MYNYRYNYIRSIAVYQISEIKLNENGILKNKAHNKRVSTRTKQYIMHNLGKHTRQLYLPNGGSGRSSNDRCFLASATMNEHVYAHEALFEESRSCQSLFEEIPHASKRSVSSNHTRWSLNYKKSCIYIYIYVHIKEARHWKGLHFVYNYLTNTKKNFTRKTIHIFIYIHIDARAHIYIVVSIKHWLINLSITVII